MSIWVSPVWSQKPLEAEDYIRQAVVRKNCSCMKEEEDMSKGGWLLLEASEGKGMRSPIGTAERS